MSFIHRIFGSSKTDSEKHSTSPGRPSTSAPSQASGAERLLLVGLGNPGVKYEQTRHNVGFLVLDRLGDTWKNAKQSALVSKTTVQGKDVYLAKPQTFMNKSGVSVRALCDYYDILPEQTIVVHDEVDIPFGDVRVKFGGGTAGHNGIKSLVQHLGTEDFWRVRFGVGRPPNPNFPLDRYVLSQWTEAERELLDQQIDGAVSLIQATIIERITPTASPDEST